MSSAHIVMLGAIAGLTIFLGLPLGRMVRPAPRVRAWLNAMAVGILLFLLWDVLAHAWEPVDGALSGHHLGIALRDGLVMAGGVLIGLLSLVYFERLIAARRRSVSAPAPVVPVQPSSSPTVGASGDAARVSARASATPRGGTGSSVAVLDRGTVAASPASALSATLANQLSLLIAIGIGLHNFAEGLAIGNSAAGGQLALAVLLIIGFGLHNATEGFGIVAPLAAAAVRPSWSRLGLLGLVGGGPTFLGTLVGQRFTSDLVSIAFLALAAGSILYVVIELLAVARRFAFKELTTWGLAVGLLLGFATDAIVTAAGA